MFAWRCACGDESAARFAAREDALRDADVHRARAGRLRDLHATLVVSSRTASSART